MANCDLTLSRLHEVLSYDAGTGIFRWRFKRGHQIAGSVAGSPNARGYVVIKVDERSHKAHRLAWLYVHGEWPSDQIDHINRDPSDNRIANLRVISNSQNRQNQTGAYKNSGTGVRGVRFSGRKFAAVIRVDRKEYHLGTFGSIEEASVAYKSARQRLHPYSPEAVE